MIASGNLFFLFLPQKTRRNRAVGAKENTTAPLKTLIKILNKLIFRKRLLLMKNASLRSLLLVPALILASCSGTNSSWPSLSDPLPSDTDRERVIERAEPTAPPAPTRINGFGEDGQRLPTMSKSLAYKTLVAVEAETEKATDAYLKSKAAIATTEKVEKLVAWREAQLMLTRLSKTTARLDSILYSENLKGESIFEKTFRVYSKHEQFVASERQLLRKLMPQVILQ